MKSRRGITLLEVLIAITLLSLLSVGMLMAMRIGLSAFRRTNDHLMENRRVAGAQRILEEQILGLIPVTAACAPDGGPGVRFGYFGGAADSLRLVSAFSLQGAWRGRPQILEMFVIPGEQGRGVRLVVNETPYTGPADAGSRCVGMAEGAVPRFPAPVARPSTFVLADALAQCRFSYLGASAKPDEPDIWTATWNRKGWPKAVRVEMVPLGAEPARLQPITVTAPVRIFRNPELPYVD
jgi:prepilin-type N-terminal cleavage/methylation domain-containing protein